MKKEYDEDGVLIPDKYKGMGTYIYLVETVEISINTGWKPTVMGIFSNKKTAISFAKKTNEGYKNNEQIPNYRFTQVCKTNAYKKIEDYDNVFPHFDKVYRIYANENEDY
jgi:hypothetical protein